MRQSPEQGNNRTGIMTAGPRADEMLAATREFPPSSPGDAQAMADVRIAYAHEGDGSQPTLLMDKLGERLAFEHAGGRLYEALLSKHRAYGSFEGGPSGEDLLHILTEEYEHADVLTHAIKELGGDPTAKTPSANLAANISVGIPQVLTDPRTNLLQCLEAVMVAELADKECWTALAQLAQQDGHEALAQQCREAIGHERDHLRKVRAWIAAGQGRELGDEGAAGMLQGADDEDGEELEEEFTFETTSPVDREGFVVSDEERTDTEEGASGTQEGAKGQSGKAGKGRSTRRKR